MGQQRPQHGLQGLYLVWTEAGQIELVLLFLCANGSEGLQDDWTSGSEDALVQDIILGVHAVAFTKQ